MYLSIEGDYNDADYTTRETQIDDWTEADYDKLERIANKLKSHETYHNWENRNGYLTKAEIGFLGEYVPCGEYGYVHSIETIEVYEKSKYKCYV